MNEYIKIGKSTLIQLFADTFGYSPIHLPLYKDLSPRDLLACRSTNPIDGSTTWIQSPLVRAALRGDLVVLEGIECIESGGLCTLKRLLWDR
jgi:von Willebrand factor A domain-containing protein 8